MSEDTFDSEEDLYKHADAALSSNLEHYVRRFGAFSTSFDVKAMGKQSLLEREVYSIQVDSDAGLSPEQSEVAEHIIQLVLKQKGISTSDFFVSPDTRSVGRFVVRLGEDIGEYWENYLESEVVSENEETE